MQAGNEHTQMIIHAWYDWTVISPNSEYLILFLGLMMVCSSISEMPLVQQTMVLSIEMLVL